MRLKEAQEAWRSGHLAFLLGYREVRRMLTQQLPGRRATSCSDSAGLSPGEEQWTLFHLG